MEDLWAAVRAEHGKGSGRDVREKPGLKSKLCWRVAQVERGVRSVCVTSEGHLLLVESFPPLIFPSLGGKEDVWLREDSCAVKRPSLFSWAEKHFLLWRSTAFQCSRKEPERIPSDLGNIAVSGFFTHRFVAVPCRFV